MSFRRKIFISYLSIFLLFATSLYPIVSFLVREVHKRSLRNLTNEIIEEITASTTLDGLIEQLKERGRFLFFRVTLIDQNQEILYDSYSDIIPLEKENIRSEPEVEDAFKGNRGYDVRFSSLFGQEMVYLGTSFTFLGKSLVLRSAFPQEQIASLTFDLSLTILLLSVAILLLYSLLAWFVIHVLTKPVHEIIRAITPYQLGEVEHIPEIRLSRGMTPNDDFEKLAQTFNSLTKHIESQIASLTRAKDEKSAILESLIEGVVAVDSTLKVVYMNRAAMDFLGVKEKIVGKHFSCVNKIQCEEILLEALANQQPAVCVLMPKKEQKRFLDVVAAPSGSGGAILVLQDKTSLHKVVEMGRDFVANASHELKTPITIIRGFAETLHDHPELSKEVCSDITEKIVSNCQRMDTLVKNLLTLASVDEGLPRSRLEECDLVDLAEQARLTILAVHPDAEIGVKVEGEEPILLMLDSDLFYQAILNLLDNAVKYSKLPAHVMIVIGKKGNEFLIKITDQGIGIPSEDLDRIFERFYAVNKSHSRSLGGSGLGLTIVKRIVEKHHGKIEVESTLGLGTTFTISLPPQAEENY